MQSGRRSVGARNNFDGVRLIAALLVLVSHHAVFLNLRQPAVSKQLSLGTCAVVMFFATSGFLVAKSWLNDPNLVRFLARRALRILPGLWVATLLLAIAGATISSRSFVEYATSPVLYRFFENALLSTHYYLPGVFHERFSNPRTLAVNGPWWTIPLEAKCYLYLGMFAALGLLVRRSAPISVAAIFLVCAFFSVGLGVPDDGMKLEIVDVGAFFFGVIVQLLEKEIRQAKIVYAALGVALILLLFACRLPLFATALAIAIGTLLVGINRTPVICEGARFGDLSFGTYLYAYFVSQICVVYWPGQASYLPTVAISVLITLVLAWLSWHIVEAKAIDLKKRLSVAFPDRARAITAQ